MQVTDYAGVVAVTPTGNLVLVQQYRPISGQFTWEFPGGLCEKEENALETATRELYEESGCHLLEGVVMGATLADTGRLRANVHHVFACVSEQDDTWRAEEGITVAVMPLTRARRKGVTKPISAWSVCRLVVFCPESPCCGRDLQKTPSAQSFSAAGNTVDRSFCTTSFQNASLSQRSKVTFVTSQWEPT